MNRLSATLLLLMFSAAARGQETQPSFQDRFGILAERNIFLRVQKPPRPVATTQPAPLPPEPPPPIETRFILRGIVADGNTFRAYVQDRTTGALIVVAKDEPVADGRLLEIDLDGAVYESSKGKRTRAELGQNLLGERPVTVSAAPAPAPAAAPVPPGQAQPDAQAGETPNPNPAPTDGEMSIEQRMRQRRMEERNQP